MNLEELLAMLGGLQDGQKYVDALKAIIADKDATITKKTKETTTVKTALKESESKTKTVTERLSAVLDHFEIDGDTEDLEEAIEATKIKLQTTKEGGAAAPEVAQLQKELSKMQRDFKKLQTTHTETEKLFNEERGKRHNGMKNQAILAALVENKAIKPETLTKLLLDNVKIGDDDSLIFVSGEGEEIPVKDGVQGWLTSNPEFLLNSQNPGAGSNAGGGAGDGQGGFAASLLKSSQPNDRLGKAESHYFGNNGQ